ncbi:MAG: hypothetical protein HYX79_05395 [Chloroflexi bacterium]|nr:hypothetical protein [Chloroflexota bacterium]
MKNNDNPSTKEKNSQLDITRLTKSTWDLAREAIQSGKTDDALRFMEQGLNLSTKQQDSLVSFVGMAVTHLAGCGEERLEKLYRERYTPRAKEWIATTPGAKESLEKFVSHMANPHTKIVITEEPGRYVMSLDPCRTGGRLRRGLCAGLSDSADFKIGATKRAWPWSWGKTGVCYYCVHSCLLFEIIPIELRGYPIAVINYADKPEDPCVFYFYKQPELIPEEYFTRVGKVKTIK